MLKMPSNVEERQCNQVSHHKFQALFEFFLQARASVDHHVLERSSPTTFRGKFRKVIRSAFPFRALRPAHTRRRR